MLALMEQILDERVAAIRGFNRFYTQRIGVLTEGLAGSGLSLTEVRVLYELGHRGATTATAIGEVLGLDAGYLSRILRRFEQAGWLRRQADPADLRRQSLSLTEAGTAALAPLEARSSEGIAALLQPLPDWQQSRLVAALQEAEGLLATPAPVTLRPHRPGDIGWVVSRHGAIYAEEYGWDIDFETMVAGLGTRFLENFDPARERCWIAARGEVRLGSVFLVRETDSVARLRMLLLEPAARGAGLGRRLVAECTGFARACGYRRIVLSTYSILLAARSIYAAAGYVRTAATPEHAYGHDLVSETWELALDGAT